MSRRPMAARDLYLIQKPDGRHVHGSPAAGDGGADVKSIGSSPGSIIRSKAGPRASASESRPAPHSPRRTQMRATSGEAARCIDQAGKGMLPS